MNTQDEMVKKVELLRKQLEESVDDPEVVLNTKKLVDELIIKLCNTTVEFIRENPEIKDRPLLCATILHRAHYFVGTYASTEWAMDIIAGRLIRGSEKLNRALHVVD